MRIETASNSALPSLSLFVCLGFWLLAGPANAFQISENPDLELARAKAKAKAAQTNYQTLKRLSEQGSASPGQLRRAELEKNLTSLELATMLDPPAEEKNRLLAARLILRFREAELKVVSDLFNHRSASQLSYRRAIAAKEIAQSNLEALTSSTETQRKLHLIEVAKSKYELARVEHQIAKRLLETGSISQPAFERATSNLKLALAELKSRQKSLGARAIQVRQ